jgi:hypothetical protein
MTDLNFKKIFLGSFRSQHHLEAWLKNYTQHQFRPVKLRAIRQDIRPDKQSKKFQR